jgi:hypothetical protein
MAIGKAPVLVAREFTLEKIRGFRGRWDLLARENGVLTNKNGVLTNMNSPNLEYHADFLV